MLTGAERPVELVVRRDIAIIEKDRLMKFEIGDIVEVNHISELCFVSGVIHDDNRLFVCKMHENIEFEVKFTSVIGQYRKVA